MSARLNYGRLAPEGLAKMRELEHALNTGSGIEPVVRELVRLRTSQLNGCEYCIAMHRGELRKLGEPEERMDAVGEWWTSGLFSERERAALAWAEAVTNIQEGYAPDEVYAAVRAQFSEAETVNLTLVITTINAWNRIAISLGGHHGRDTEAVAARAGGAA